MRFLAGAVVAHTDELGGAGGWAERAVIAGATRKVTGAFSERVRPDHWARESGDRSQVSVWIQYKLLGCP